MTIAKNNKSTRRNKSVKRTGKASVKSGNRRKTLPNEDKFWPGRNFHKEFDSKCTLNKIFNHSDVGDRIIILTSPISNRSPTSVTIVGVAKLDII